MMTLFCMVTAMAVTIPALLLWRHEFVQSYRREVLRQYGAAAFFRLPDYGDMYWDFFRTDWSSWLRI